MQLHNIKRNKPNKKPSRVARGGKRGKTSGRGHKGQMARAGRKVRPEMRDIIKKLPKLRGRGKNSNKGYKPAFIPLNLSTLDKVLSDGFVATPKSLVEAKIVSMKKGKLPLVKILGTGEITKKITIEGIATSETAKSKIEKAGGKVTA
ncbi:50S ribosomal protein L15 [Candidatus Wolfebacteria bacterium]|nr:MAG: 50S ribosomal protein L15 [Candidatus Wolfebacteria bacterium]